MTQRGGSTYPWGVHPGEWDMCSPPTRAWVTMHTSLVCFASKSSRKHDKLVEPQKDARGKTKEI